MNEETSLSGPGGETTKPNAPENTPKHAIRTFVWEVVKFAVLALIIVVPIRMYIASPFLVSGASMEPTFDTGHYLIVDELSYRFEKPKRGEVVVFKYPKDPSKFFIKRIIGLPGETVSINDGAVVIKNAAAPAGFILSEPYVQSQKYDTLEVTLGDTEYFVMGDNRDASADSRIWGPLPENLITGRALIRLFPITQAAVFPGEAEY
ncbi:MAG: signal peptidase I [Patescibacteria group bacterium]